MTIHSGKAFQIIQRIAEGVRQRLLYESDRLRIAEYAEQATEEMVRQIAKELDLEKFESDFELLFDRP